MTDEGGAVTYAANYTPYGEVLSTAGEGVLLRKKGSVRWPSQTHVCDMAHSGWMP